MKSIVLIFTYVFTISMVSCEKGNPSEQSKPGKTEIVTKVFDYNNELMANYEYNENNQLIKRKFTDPKSKASSDFIFHYENGLVNVVEYIDHQSPENSHEKHYFYTNDGRVDKIETHKDGRIMSTFILDYSDRGLVESIHSDDQEPSTFYTYDSRGNVVKTTKHILNRFGEEYTRTYEFTYDKKNKVNFGLDYLVGIEFLPKRGTTSNWEQSLSQNNLLSEGYAGTKHVEYIIEYDRNNYPKTITTKWKDIETENPMTIRIENREE